MFSLWPPRILVAHLFWPPTSCLAACCLSVCSYLSICLLLHFFASPPPSHSHSFQTPLIELHITQSHPAHSPASSAARPLFTCSPALMAHLCLGRCGRPHPGPVAAYNCRRSRQTIVPPPPFSLICIRPTQCLPFFCPLCFRPFPGLPKPGKSVLLSSASGCSNVCVLLAGSNNLLRSVKIMNPPWLHVTPGVLTFFCIDRHLLWPCHLPCTCVSMREEQRDFFSHLLWAEQLSAIWLQRPRCCCSRCGRLLAAGFPPTMLHTPNLPALSAAPLNACSYLLPTCVLR